MKSITEMTVNQIKNKIADVKKKAFADREWAAKEIAKYEAELARRGAEKLAKAEKKAEAKRQRAAKRAAKTVGPTKSLRARFVFETVGLLVGDVIVLNEDSNITATVNGANTIEFNGVTYGNHGAKGMTSLTAFTKMMLGLPYESYVRPTDHWTCQGISLKDLYELNY